MLNLYSCMVQNHGEQQRELARNYRCSVAGAYAQSLNYTGPIKPQMKKCWLGQDRTTTDRTRNSAYRMEMVRSHTGFREDSLG
jgi:hypothetical protein